MKLRNKKTGQEGNFIINKNHFECVDLDYVPEYRNLAELNEEWEDYEEEPKEYWFIDAGGEVLEETYLTDNDKSKLRNFGNYFETKEEAEKAVEKLNAWKRLKDKGFSIDGYTNDIGDNYYMPSDFVIKLNYNGDHRKSYPDDVFKDLELLFGGEK